MSDATPALEFRDIACLCGPRPLFDGFDLEVPRGKVLGVLGPNGCGKSTLLGLADGLGMPARGTVLVGGRPVAGLSARERAGRIALLPQVHRTPSMRVRDLVACGRYAHMGPFGQLGEKDERAVDDALSLMGLRALAHRNARRLSGGERQRAFIAMALAQEADVLLLDEPTTYLDVSAAHELMSLVRRLVAERGTTVVRAARHRPGPALLRRGGGAGARAADAASGPGLARGCRGWPRASRRVWRHGRAVREGRRARVRPVCGRSAGGDGGGTFRGGAWQAIGRDAQARKRTGGKTHGREKSRRARVDPPACVRWLG